MKKALLLLLTGGLLSAQTSDLLSYNWYMTKMVTNSGQTTNAPAKDGPIPASTFVANGGTSFTFSSNYVNTSTLGFNTMSGSTYITKSSGGCTSTVYNGTNATAVIDYDQKNCNLYNDGTNGAFYHYEIQTNGNTKTLIMTAPLGDKFYYDGVAIGVLGTSETASKNKTFSAYPNPVKEELTIDNISKNLSVKIYDFSGKLVQEGKTTDGKTKINTNDLPKGQYILSVENHKGQTFIKN
ncbi:MULTISPECIES: T9SS type A sorting domain-containing protein [unclassified Chryseobacterium]|uniref:T9SS type A sorting domain-containing protein n=1 Tax=unclassified Chryseobacterium TaxID=2593645 RepID=UPI00226A2C8A|nr:MULTISPECIES: T9SS type A sorting domain-containing protein [unclassified Chryseobacterium]